MRSCRTPRTPPRSEGRQNHNVDDIVSSVDLSMTPGQKRLREDGTPPGVKPEGKKSHTLSADQLKVNGPCGLNLNNDHSVAGNSLFGLDLNNDDSVAATGPCALNQDNDDSVAVNGPPYGLLSSEDVNGLGVGLDISAGVEAFGSKCKLSSVNAWEAASSFAEVLKGPSKYQIAIKTEPLKQFTTEERLEFIDAVGEAIFETSDGLPLFDSTTIKGNFLIVSAVNEFSFDWLIAKASSIHVWQGFDIKACSADEIPRIKKALLWLPGKRSFPSEELINRLEKANPSLGCKSWRVFSRKNESHGCRLLIGFEETHLESLMAIEMRPYWSTVRARITLVEEVKKRQFKVPRDRVNKESKYVEEKLVTPNPPPLSEAIPTEVTIIDNLNGESSESVGSQPPPTKEKRRRPGRKERIRGTKKSQDRKDKDRESSQKITSFLRQKSEVKEVTIPPVVPSSATKTNKSFLQSKLSFSPGTSQQCGASSSSLLNNNNNINVIDVRDGDVSQCPSPIE